MSRPLAPTRLIYLVSHPIQYQAPLLRKVAALPGVDLKVIFLSDFSARTYHDQGFDAAVRWDVPLLEGYESEALSSLPSIRFHRPFVPRMATLLERERADVLWVHGWNQASLLAAIQAAHRCDIPVLLRGESKPEPRSRPRRAALRFVLDRVSGALAIGSANRRFYRDLGVREERLFDVPYAVDNDFFRERASASASGRAGLRASLGLEPGRPVILFASKLIERKRPRDLWRAYQSLAGPKGTEPHPYLLFVGDGPARGELERATHARGWNSVRWLGFRNQSELPPLYDLCDVFVLPSAYETWGLALNEAMNAARPVITTRGVGAAEDLVCEGLSGHVIDVGDVDALAARLREVTGDTEHAARMGRAGLRRVAHYSLDAACDGLQGALDATARVGRRSRAA